jgi:hypothetical protein
MDFISYWVAIDENFVLISMSVSEETHRIGDKDYHVVEHESGHKKLMTEKGVKEMIDASDKVESLLT